MSHSDATIKELEHRLVKVQALQAKIQEAIALLRDLGGVPNEEEHMQVGPPGPIDGISPEGVEIDGRPLENFPGIDGKGPEAASVVSTEDPDVSAAKKSALGLRKNPASQYTGVTKYPPDRWKGLASIRGKMQWCGIHKVEELAAAAVQEKLGNPELAQGLRDLAEQKKNKPNHGLVNAAGWRAEGVVPTDLESQTLGWECNRCSRLHEQELKPKECEQCMATSFTRILPSGEGASDHVVTEREPGAEPTSPFTLQVDEVEE